MFCENVMTLVRWMCKNYNTFNLFNMYFFFFLIIDLCSFFLYIKARMCVQCFCTVHLVFLRCTSIVPFCWTTLSFLFFFSFFFLNFKFWIVAIVPSWFNQLCWGKIHYSTYNFFGLTFCIFFSLHTILNKNT